MDEETAERVVEKAEYVRDCLEVLAEKRSLDRDVYFADRDAQDVVERRFETAIQACIDIAGLLLKAEGETVPEVYADRMVALVDIGVLSASLGDRMASATGFRNVLAHRYGPDVDDELVYESLQDLDRFHRYLTAVRDHLSACDAL